jgi:hypothetical protein
MAITNSEVEKDGLHKCEEDIMPDLSATVSLELS